MTNPNIASRYLTLLILWFAICTSIAVLMVLIWFVKGNPAGNSTLALVLEFAAVFPFGASFLLKQQFLSKAVAERKLDLVQTAYVMAFALCEASALLGLLDHFVNGSKFFYVGFILGVLGMLLHFPLKKHLLAATGQEF